MILNLINLNTLIKSIEDETYDSNELNLSTYVLTYEYYGYIKRLFRLLDFNPYINILNLSESSLSHCYSSELMKKLNYFLKTNNTITSLNLSHTCIESPQLISISNSLISNSTLTSLNLNNNPHIGVKGIKALCDMLLTNNSITELNLEKCNIGSDCLKSISIVLKTNSTLTSLNLSNNSEINYKKTGMQLLCRSLKINNSLTSLNLSNNSIRDDYIKMISEMLKINTTICELNLERNFLYKESYQSICDALKVNSTLTNLNLKENIKINEEIVYLLSEALTFNTTLTKLDF